MSYFKSQILKPIFLLFFLFLSCTSEDEIPPIDSLLELDRSIRFVFADSSEIWQGGFSDFQSKLENDLKLSYGIEPLPLVFLQPENSQALSWRSLNTIGEPLFMFASRKISTLKPNTEYSVGFAFETGFQILEGNEFVLRESQRNIYLKAGVTNFLPNAVESEVNDGVITPNFDKGLSPNGSGRDLTLMGNLIVGQSAFRNILTTSLSSQPIIVQTNSEGEVWAIIGADSVVPIGLAFYINRIQIDLKEVQ